MEETKVLQSRKSCSFLCLAQVAPDFIYLFSLGVAEQPQCFLAREGNRIDARGNGQKLSA